jgi:hypothetical protein
MAKRADPLDQLALVSSELDRQLDNVSTRQANALTRSSIVLAAAGVTAFTTTGPLLGWNTVPTLFSLLSALLSIRAIAYWRSSAVQTRRKHVAALLGATPYDLMWRQVIDKFVELDAARDDLDRKTNYLAGALAMLIIAWVSAVSVKFLIEPLLGVTSY